MGEGGWGKRVGVLVMLGMNEMYTQEVRSKGKPRICMKTFSSRTET